MGDSLFIRRSAQTVCHLKRECHYSPTLTKHTQRQLEELSIGLHEVEI